MKKVCGYIILVILSTNALLIGSSLSSDGRPGDVLVFKKEEKKAFRTKEINNIIYKETDIVGEVKDIFNRFDDGAVPGECLFSGVASVFTAAGTTISFFNKLFFPLGIINAMQTALNITTVLTSSTAKNRKRATNIVQCIEVLFEKQIRGRDSLSQALAEFLRKEIIEKVKQEYVFLSREEFLLKGISLLCAGYSLGLSCFTAVTENKETGVADIFTLANGILTAGSVGSIGFDIIRNNICLKKKLEAFDRRLTDLLKQYVVTDESNK